MTEYTIGQLAKIVDLPPKTIRFYEDKKLISEATRSPNGYRKYQESSVEELKVIKYARDLGLPISEIKRLLQGCCTEKGCNHSREYLDNYIQSYSQKIDDRINELISLKNKLLELEFQIDDSDLSCSPKNYCCNIFYQIITNIQKQKGGDKS